MRDSKAYDMLVQAESGVVAVTGTPDAPAKVGISIADIASGLYAYSSILAALLQREQDRRRRAHRHLDARVPHRVDDAGAVRVAWARSRSSARAGVRHNMIVPYGAYACADGEVMFADSDRSRVAALLRRRCWATPRWPTMSVS